MQSFVCLVAAAIFLLSSCGTKKTEERLPREPQLSEGVPSLPVIPPQPSLAPLALSSIELLTPPGDAENGKCLNRIELQREQLDLYMNEQPFAYDPLGLSDQWDCRVMLTLEVPPAWSFAVRGIEIPVEADLKPMASARIYGEFGIHGKQQWQHTFGSEMDGLPQLAARTVADGALDWSPCGGRAELEVSLGAALQPAFYPLSPEALEEAVRIKGPQLGDYGQIEFARSAPYRLNLIWVPCAAPSALSP